MARSGKREEKERTFNSAQFSYWKKTFHFICGRVKIAHRMGALNEKLFLHNKQNEKVSVCRNEVPLIFEVFQGPLWKLFSYFMVTFFIYFAWGNIYFFLSWVVSFLHWESARLFRPTNGIGNCLQREGYLPGVSIKNVNNSFYCSSGSALSITWGDKYRRKIELGQTNFSIISIQVLVFPIYSSFPYFLNWDNQYVLRKRRKIFNYWLRIHFHR